MKPYTYLVGWSKFHLFYYGVQYGKTANPKNLWKTYFTSSKVVKEFAETNGDPDIIQIRQVFDSPEKAKEWERKVLTRMKVTESSVFMNQHNNHAPPINQGHSDETRQKLSAVLRGKKKSPEHIQKILPNLKQCASETAKFRKGKKLEEIYGDEKAAMVKEKIRAARAAQIITKESRKKAVESRRMGAGWSARSSETKEKISQTFKGKRLYTNGRENKFFTPGKEPPGFYRKSKERLK